MEFQIIVEGLSRLIKFFIFIFIFYDLIIFLDFFEFFEGVGMGCIVKFFEFLDICQVIKMVKDYLSLDFV